MAILEVKIDLGRIASALEKIAVILERAVPPVELDRLPKPARLIDIDPAAIAEAEEEAERKAMTGIEEEKEYAP